MSATEDRAIERRGQDYTLAGAFFVALLGLIGSLVAQAWATRAQAAAQELQARNGLVLALLESDDPATATANLRFALDAGLLDDPGGRLAATLEEREAPSLTRIQEVGAGHFSRVVPVLLRGQSAVTLVPGEPMSISVRNTGSVAIVMSCYLAKHAQDSSTNVCPGFTVAAGESRSCPPFDVPTDPGAYEGIGIRVSEDGARVLPRAEVMVSQGESRIEWRIEGDTVITYLFPLGDSTE